MSLILFAGQALCGTVITGASESPGTLMQWHKVTLTIDGPSSSETGTPNPFLDYRMNVTFEHPGTATTYLVPGYFAADGNAANTSATSGTQWRVHLCPDYEGTWHYTVSFRQGKDVAVNDSATAGTALPPYDGITGSFTVVATDKTGRDMRAKGRLEYVGGHFLQFAGNGEYFVKQGADAPENFLAYEDFDGPFKTDGQRDDLIKSWSPHAGDWHLGDPVWQTNKGKEIIGAINYLSSEGLNAFSFLPMNINGDDKNVFPYTNYNERYRMDCSRLDQWEIVFEHGDRMGMFLHFKTQETENELLLDSGNLGTQRKLYYRELIARFSHHLALNWNLGEEINNASTAQKVSWAQYFYNTDPYHHHIVIHNGANHYELMGTASKLTGFSLQTNNADFSNVFTKTKDYINRSVTAGKPWAVACDEPGDASHALRPDYDAGNSHKDGRKNGLWGHYMAGGWGNEWYFGYQHVHSDLTCQDFRSRNAYWDYCRYALQFFTASNDSNRTPVPLQNMKNRDDLVTSGQCLYSSSDAEYVVYLASGGATNLNLQETGTFEVKWFDPRNGGGLQDGTVFSVTGSGSRSLGNAPSATTSDWAILVRPSVDTVDPGDDMITWSGQPVQLDPNVGGTPFTYAWSADPDAGVVFSNPNVEAPTVTITKATDNPSIVTLTLAVDGETGLQEDIMTIDVYDTACLATIGAGLGAANPADLDGDCITGFGDLGVMAAKWLTDNALTAPTELPTELGPILITLNYSPLDDAYKQGTSYFNDSVLKVEPGYRVSYLKFNIADIRDGYTVTNASLQLTENGDVGTGTLRFYRGSNNTWTETTLNASNEPATQDQVGIRTGSVTGGQTVIVDVTPLVTANGIYSLVVMMDSGGNDIWFGSKESSKVPLLTVAAHRNN